MPLNVAVIGTGASGLCTLRHLAKDPSHFTPVAFDRATEVGGLWMYSDKTTVDEYGLPVHNCLYTNLRTNLSKEVMLFPDYPAPKNLPSYPHHTDIKRYLQNYALEFDLIKYIKTLVIKVQRMATKGRNMWLVETRNLPSKSESTFCFDAVIVCNGHESIPRIPDIPGRDIFQGQIMHTKSFRNPEPFRNKTVVVLGMSFSGMDMMYSVSPVAKLMYCAHDNPQPLASKIPPNVTEKPGIREITHDGVVFKNGQCVQCDVILFATGYHYSFPFLHEDCHVTTEGDRVTPLYKHMFHVEHPTLCIIGLAKRALVYRIANLQAQFACAVLRGDAKLPPEADMRKDEEKDFQKRIVSAKQQTKMTHDLFGSVQWEYFDFLSDQANSENVPEAVRELFDFHVGLWGSYFHDFRSLNFHVIGEREFQVEALLNQKSLL